MVLKFPGVENNMFDTSRASDEGIGSRKKESSFWSCPGISFNSTNSGEDYQDSGGNYICFSNQSLRVTIMGIPNGASIIKAFVSGITDAVETWTLTRHNNDGTGATTMATANINSSDKTIIEGLVDNNKYSYFIVTSLLNGATEDAIESARVDYTI